MKRRSFVKLSALVSTWIFTGCFMSNHNIGYEGGNSSSVNNALPIPKLLQPTIKDDVNHYELIIKESKHSFFDNIQTDTYAINGTYLGPTIKVSNGDEVSLNFTNTLKEPTTMHGHGMHLPPDMDGTPHQVIAPNQTWSARYKVLQKACTNWYHPHFMGKTAEHVYKGLAGFIIIEDAESNSLDLPNRYGIDDIVLALQDRKFANNQINYNPSMMEIMMGYIGNTFITNGAIEPIFEAEAKEVRFRILNGSNSTVYNLGFSDNRSFNQIATDNSLLIAPVSLNRLTLSPGERAEIVVDLSSDLGSRLQLREYRYGKTFLKIDINKRATSTSTLPSNLASLDNLNPKDAVKTRKFVLGGGMMSDFTINGKSMNINRIDEIIPLGDIEIWEVVNSMNIDHNFHIHATHFMIIERNGSSSKVALNEKGYKDTVYLKGGESMKFIVQMVDYKDVNTPYMYHCHFLEHEDAGMMGQFRVV
jgi:FtsP/CotA-like multicopper oxidase with cupredoxin domain